MRNVAIEAGCSTAALYRHFSGRTALLQSMWADAVDALASRTLEVEAEVADPIERIRAVMAAYAELAARDPDAFVSTFLQIWTPTPERLVVDEPEKHASYRVLRRAVRDAVELGRFGQSDPDVGAQAIWAAVHGTLALPWNLGDFPFAESDVRLRTAIDIVIRGLSKA